MFGDKSLEYTQLLTGARKAKILKQIHFEKPELLIQLKSGEQVSSQVVEKGPLGFQIRPVNESSLENGDRLILSFIVNSEKILCATHLIKRNHAWYVPDTLELFLVQRRDNFRAPILGHMKLDGLLTQLNGGKIDIGAKVVNLSLGGCLLELPIQHESKIHAGVSIDGMLISDQYGEIGFKAEIRRVEKNLEYSFLLVGMEFKSLSSGAEPRLHELIMKCARESSKYLSE